MKRTRITLTAEETSALADCICYYSMSDFGCGGIEPEERTDEQNQHRTLMRSVEGKVEAADRRVNEWPEP